MLPAIGEKPVADVTIPDIFALTDAVEARGADPMAPQTRNGIKRLTPRRFSCSQSAVRRSAPVATAVVHPAPTGAQKAVGDSSAAQPGITPRRTDRPHRPGRGENLSGRGADRARRAVVRP